MEKVIIRPIEEKDNKEIAALIRKVFEEFDAPKTESVYKQLYIESFPQFQNAVSLYERKGFRHLESRLGNSGHTTTTIHMIKIYRNKSKEISSGKLAERLKKAAKDLKTWLVFFKLASLYHYLTAKV